MMSRLTLFRRATLVAMALTVGAGCNQTTAPDAEESEITPPNFTTATFAGTLERGGSLFYSFVVSNRGQASLTLAALQTPGGAALTTPVAIGVGIPQGTGCPQTTSITTPPGLSAQLATTLNPGTYCAAIQDVGQLTAAVNFAMRITYP